MVNYCQSCRRHLNGAVSCPGCGAAVVAAPEPQDPRPTDWTTQVAWPERDPLPAAEARARAQAGNRSQAARRPALHVGKADGREPVPTGDAVADSANGHRARRSRKRRGPSLRATVTGGFAGVAVIGLLVLGNLPTVGGNASAGGAAATTFTAGSQQDPGPMSTSDVTVPTVTGGDSKPAPATTQTNPGSKPTASATTAATTPPSPTASDVAIQSAAAQAQASQAATPSTVSSSTQSSPPATQAATTPAAPAPSPSPSQTHVTCILIICW